ncbi:hypothetical protein EGW08_010818 [Elysia chlorotica]|uniref:C-type lectin domain-containing protein n=1 Tax=Elysia chlorotica TaxID=188477 RepID=A0A433TIN4_ELYCH|nr:hypothetical protein EGW08_010818 [Elysia chlorotica]
MKKNEANRRKKKRGRRRKRRTNEERDAHATEKLNNKMRRHSMLEGCSRDKCRKKCHEHFNDCTREEINNASIWRMDYLSQRVFIRQLVTVREFKEKKKDTENYWKGSTCPKSYTFRKSDGEYPSVCQLFFLNTLGLKSNKNKMIRKAFEVAGASSNTREVFLHQTSYPECQSVHLGGSWIAPSLIACQIWCMDTENCQAVVFNEESGLCRLGSAAFGPLPNVTNVIPETTSLDKLYYTKQPAPPCDTANNFAIYDKCGTSACLYLSTSRADGYEDAKTICAQMNSTLYIGNTLAKYSLFWHVSKYIVNDNTFIDLTDIEVEGTVIPMRGETGKLSSAMILWLLILFKVAGASSNTREVFLHQTSYPECQSVHLGGSWIAPSLIACQIWCMDTENCQAVVFNEASGLCRLGSAAFGPLPNFTDVIPETNSLDKIYYTKQPVPPCDTANNFAIYDKCGTSACLYLSTSRADGYEDAKTICGQMNSRLYIGNTLAKYSLFWHVSKYIVNDNTFIDLTDIDVEGTVIPMREETGKLSSAMILWLLILFKVAGASSNTREVFLHQTSYPECQSVHLGGSWIAPSLIACQIWCMDTENCQAVVFNEASGLCRLGSAAFGPLPNFTNVIPETNSLDKIYYTKQPAPPCDTANNFAIYDKCGTSACLYLSTSRADGYEDAKTICAQMNSKLYIGNTLAKYSLFWHVSKLIINDNTFIDLTDIEVEGTYVWGNGEPLSAEQQQYISNPGEPSNFNNEHCAEAKHVRYGTTDIGLNDVHCTIQDSYVCERCEQC